MRTFQSRIGAFFLCIAFVFPSVATAASVGDYLQGEDDAFVTRGGFIRAAVRTLNIPTVGAGGGMLPYVRVPQALLPFVEVAHRREALEIFGEDLLLAQDIKRGEALQIIVALQSLSSSSRASV